MVFRLCNYGDVTNEGILNSALKALCNATHVNETLVSIQRSDLLVLNYHGVLARPRADAGSYGNDMDAESFRSQLRWLKQHLIPTDLSGLKRFYRGKWTERKPPVLVTFDDGYRNNLTVAAPILLEESMPAIFFLATGYLGTDRVLWNDEIRARVRHWPESEIDMPSGQRSTLPSEADMRRTIANDINQACKRLPEERRTEYLEFLRSKTPSLATMDDPEARAFMDWDEARELAKMGFEIGSHTVEHPILSTIDRKRMTAELRDSKAAIERKLQLPCNAIAYPNGSSRDVNETVFEEVRAAGYDWAFMTTPIWQKAGGDPHKISRIGFPGHTDLGTFKFYVSGLHTRLSKLV